MTLGRGRTARAAEPAERRRKLATAGKSVQASVQVIRQNLALIEQLLSQATFPAVPNRWLVKCEGGKRPKRSWVVESDYLYTDRKYYRAVYRSRWAASRSQSRATPAVRQACRFFTWAAALTWTAGPECRVAHPPEHGHPHNEATDPYLADPLTAVGYGEPTFAAFYPNCHSVFGFYDDEIQPKTACDVAGPSTPSAAGMTRCRTTTFTTSPPVSNPLRRTVGPERAATGVLYEEFGWRIPISISQADFKSRASLKAQASAIWRKLREIEWMSRPPAMQTGTVLPTAAGSRFQLTGPLQPLLGDILAVIDKKIREQRPSRIVCYSEFEIGKQPSLVPLDGEAKVSVAVGMTGGEALSAYLTKAINATPSQEQTITQHLEAARLASRLDNNLLDLGPRFAECCTSPHSQRRGRRFVVVGAVAWLLDNALTRQLPGTGRS